ncbi:MAG: ATP-dependent 6-phosphofructokinase [Isosphaeraceae bacterium]
MGEHGTRIEIQRLGPPRWDSPLRAYGAKGTGVGRFVSDGTWVRSKIEIGPEAANQASPPPEQDDDYLFEKAGPRDRIFFDPARTRAAVVTCGGLSPGLNSVIRSLYLELHHNYGVREVLGIRQGYRGLNPREGLPPIPLTCELVDDIHKEGGTILASSRGEQDVGVMVDYLVNSGIDILFCVGGDGTQRGAAAIAEEIRRRRLDLAVVGIPKTIDNDIAFCTRTFGHVTAIEEASKVLQLAHVEAKGAPRAIGLVKLMGRHAGFIVCGAVLGSQEVNFALIPEVPFEMEGPDGLLEHLAERMDSRDHAVIAVAEGAGQHLFADQPSPGLDASKNKRHHDIGAYLRDRIVAYFETVGRPIVMKYFDPSYIIRSVSPDTDDSILCDQLARRAVHAAMAGKTDLVVSYLNESFVHVPIAMVVGAKRQVDPEGELWASVLATTGQPPRIGR